MKLLVAVLTLLCSANAFADLPTWVKSSAKNAALDQFVTWMKGAEFYRIVSVETSEIKDDSGGNAVRVRLSFDDAKGCKGRVHDATCSPIDDHTLACLQVITDCVPPGIRKTEQIISAQ